MRRISFSSGQFYHIYNRGVDKRAVFLKQAHYSRMMKTIERLLEKGSATSGRLVETPLKKSVDIVGYCLMPNHYHFLIKQKRKNGISELMHRLNTSYTKYFNMAEKRTGRLFEYTYKAVHVVTDEQLLHLSRYIHLNPLMSGLTDDLDKYHFSSYLEFTGKRKADFCKLEKILGFYAVSDAKEDYEKFVLDHADFMKSKEEIRRLCQENCPG